MFGHFLFNECRFNYKWMEMKKTCFSSQSKSQICRLALAWRWEFIETRTQRYPKRIFGFALQMVKRYLKAFSFFASLWYCTRFPILYTHTHTHTNKHTHTLNVFVYSLSLSLSPHRVYTVMFSADSIWPRAYARSYTTSSYPPPLPNAQKHIDKSYRHLKNRC